MKITTKKNKKKQQNPDNTDAYELDSFPRDQ